MLGGGGILLEVCLLRPVESIYGLGGGAKYLLLSGPGGVYLGGDMLKKILGTRPIALL